LMRNPVILSSSGFRLEFTPYHDTGPERREEGVFQSFQMIVLKG
jgi:hypothetical protein